MKEIYIYQAIGTKSKSLIGIIFPYLVFCFCILFVMIELMDIDNEFVDVDKLKLMFAFFIGIGGTYHSFYILTPPQIQIDSLNFLLIYKGRREYYSIRLKDIQHFSITDNGVILHSKKVIRIPFSEFEHIDLINFFNTMNKIIETNMNFYTMFSKDKKIQGFNYLKGQSMAQICRQESSVITNFFWYRLPLIAMITMVIIFSIVELTLWFIFG